MALINPSTALTEIVTTTLRNRTGKLADNVTKNNALLYRLRAKGKVKPVSGGRAICQRVELPKNGTLAPLPHRHKLSVYLQLERNSLVSLRALIAADTARLFQRSRFVHCIARRLAWSFGSLKP